MANITITAGGVALTVSKTADGSLGSFTSQFPGQAFDGSGGYGNAGFKLTEASLNSAINDSLSQKNFFTGQSMQAQIDLGKLQRDPFSVMGDPVTQERIDWFTKNYQSKIANANRNIAMYDQLIATSSDLLANLPSITAQYNAANPDGAINNTTGTGKPTPMQSDAVEPNGAPKPDTVVQNVQPALTTNPSSASTIPAPTDTAPLTVAPASNSPNVAQDAATTNALADKIVPQQPIVDTEFGNLAGAQIDNATATSIDTAGLDAAIAAQAAIAEKETISQAEIDAGVAQAIADQIANQSDVNPNDDPVAAVEEQITRDVEDIAPQVEIDPNDDPLADAQALDAEAFAPQVEIDPNDDPLADAQNQVTADAEAIAPPPEDESTYNGVTNSLLKAQSSATAQDVSNFKQKEDWRVRLSLDQLQLPGQTLPRPMPVHPRTDHLLDQFPPVGQYPQRPV